MYKWNIPMYTKRNIYIYNMTGDIPIYIYGISPVIYGISPLIYIYIWDYMGYGFQTTYAHFEVSNLSMDAIDGNAAKR